MLYSFFVPLLALLLEYAMRIRNYPVPRNKIKDFHEILCKTGGRYLRTPTIYPNEVRVDFEPGNWQAQEEAWQRVMTPVREKDGRPGLLLRTWRRVRLFATAPRALFSRKSARG